MKSSKNLYLVEPVGPQGYFVPFSSLRRETEVHYTNDVWAPMICWNTNTEKLELVTKPIVPANCEMGDTALRYDNAHKLGRSYTYDEAKAVDAVIKMLKMQGIVLNCHRSQNTPYAHKDLYPAYTFNGFDMLTNIKDLTIPKGIGSINPYAFYNKQFDTVVIDCEAVLICQRAFYGAKINRLIFNGQVQAQQKAFEFFECDELIFNRGLMSYNDNYFENAKIKAPIDLSKGWWDNCVGESRVLFNVNLKAVPSFALALHINSLADLQDFVLVLNMCVSEPINMLAAVWVRHCITKPTWMHIKGTNMRDLTAEVDKLKQEANHNVICK